MKGTGAASAGERATSGRLALAYVTVLAFLAAAVGVSVTLGGDEHAQPAVAGFYRSTSDCLGPKFKFVQSGWFVDLSGGPSGKLRLRHRRLTGSITCRDGARTAADLRVTGARKSAVLAGAVGPETVSARFAGALPKPGVSAKQPPRRSSEETFGRLMLAIAAVILAARLVGTAVGRLGQPRVMGEVLAGILLGPTLLGAVWPEAKDYLFPPDIVPLL